MFGNLGEMAKLMQRAKTIQSDMAKMKEQLAGSEFAGSAPGGQVRVLVSGDFRVKTIVIAPEAVADRELLEDQLTVALNDALNQAKMSAQQQMSELTGGMNLPGLF